MKKLFFLCLIVSSQLIGYGQKLSDTLKVEELTMQGQEVYLSHPDSATRLWKKALGLNNLILKTETSPEIYERLLIRKSDLLFNLSQIYRSKGDVNRALEYIKDALKIDEMLNNKANMSSSYNDIGVLYNDLGLFEIALDNYVKSLELDRELKNDQGIAASLINIGYLHSQLHNEKEALKCFNESFEIQKKIGDSSGMITSLNNLSSVYYTLGVLDSSTLFIDLSYPLAKTLDNKSSLANIYSRKGQIFNKSQTDSAYHYFQKALDLRTEINDLDGIYASNLEIATFYSGSKNYTHALAFAEKAFIIAKQLEYPKLISNASKKLSELHSIMGDFKKAYQMLEQHNKIEMDAQINDKSRKLFKRHLDSEYNLKQENDSIRKQAEIDRKNLEVEKAQAIVSKKETTLFFTLIGLMVLTLAFLYLIRLNRQKQRAFKIIEEQKAIVEVKNQEIVDSIVYAKQLQTAILPPRENLDNVFKSHFIMYQPKDIVAGDFYWMEQLSEHEVMVAVADCTGHGVPGAMVSVVCSNALSKAVTEDKISQPSKVLDKTREIVIQKFNQGAQSKLKDGMDISLCKIDFKEQRIEWSGAYNPLLIFEKDKNALNILKADKMPIGHGSAPTPFTNHTLNFSKGDRIYMYTDGFADQFGGTDSNGKVKGKKYKTKRLHTLIQQNAVLDPPDQLSCFQKEFDQWKGNLEQIDDVCLMGILL